MPSRRDAVPGREGIYTASDRAPSNAQSQEPPSRFPGTGSPASNQADVSWPVPDAARWIVESGTPFEQLIAFGPSVFEAYARLRFIPDPSWPSQDEADIILPENHLPELVQTQRALHHLEQFTGTPADCYFCVWEGYPDIALAPKVSESELVVLPHRRYMMFRSPLSRIDSFAGDFGSGRNISPPAFIWPADHSWCFARDVDPHWAGLGAQRAALDSLAADALLDVVSAAPGEPQPRYG